MGELSGKVNCNPSAAPFDSDARLGWLPLIGSFFAFAAYFFIGDRSARLLLIIYFVAGLMAAIYYLPAPYILVFVSDGMVGLPPTCRTPRIGGRDGGYDEGTKDPGRAAWPLPQGVPSKLGRSGH